jgi:capsular polysaccharide biosynthesis protein
LWMECRDPFEDIPASVIRGFQARMAAAYSAVNSPKRRIFIERAHLRGVLNSAEMSKFLTERGFTAYRLEEMPFEEQVSLFSNAEFVISPHGAGLSNLIFSPKGTKVLELMPDVESRPFFWHLSATLGQRYGLMACPAQSKSFNGRLHVDQQRLKSLYDLLEAA